MTVEQILDATRSWSEEKKCELITRLEEDIGAAQVDLEIDSAWKKEVRLRLARIEAGDPTEKGEVVSERIRRIVRRLSHIPSRAKRLKSMRMRRPIIRASIQTLGNAFMTKLSG
jgi:hypothetical protein